MTVFSTAYKRIKQLTEELVVSDSNKKVDEARKVWLTKVEGHDKAEELQLKAAEVLLDAELDTIKHSDDVNKSEVYKKAVEQFNVTVEGHKKAKAELQAAVKALNDARSEFAGSATNQQANREIVSVDPVDSI